MRKLTSLAIPFMLLSAIAIAAPVPRQAPGAMAEVKESMLGDSEEVTLALAVSKQDIGQRGAVFVAVKNGGGRTLAYYNGREFVEGRISAGVGKLPPLVRMAIRPGIRLCEALGIPQKEGPAQTYELWAGYAIALSPGGGLENVDENAIRASIEAARQAGRSDLVRQLENSLANIAAARTRTAVANSSEGGSPDERAAYGNMVRDRQFWKVLAHTCPEKGEQ